MATSTDLKTIKSAGQRERLWQIDFLARFRGHLTRQDLVDRFDIARSNATRDLTLYRELAPGNLEYNNSDKTYCRASGFAPLFSYDREHTLQALTLGQARGFDPFEQSVVVEAANNLNAPDLDILAILSRAIYTGVALRAAYVSASNGDSVREIVPHALVNTGLRWHVRAFCRHHQDFRDFVLTRFLKADILPGLIANHESSKQDLDWHNEATLELVPHPKASFKRAIELDYALHSNEVLQLKVRAAIAGYLLRRWGVDCSARAVLPAEEYQLYLRNRSALSEIASLSIAPGFYLEAHS